MVIYVNNEFAWSTCTYELVDGNLEAFVSEGKAVFNDTMVYLC